MLEESRLKERGQIYTKEVTAQLDLHYEGNDNFKQFATTNKVNLSSATLNTDLASTRKDLHHTKDKWTSQKLTKAELDYWRRVAASKRRSAHFER
jgi:hypothetical protein